MSRRYKPRWWRILRARLYFARKTREWPWNVPWQVVYISRTKPPESVFRHFQRLHGLPEIGSDPTAPQPPLARDPEWPDLSKEC